MNTITDRESDFFAGIETMLPELWVLRGAAPSMVRPHSHDDLELNLVVRGRLDYLFGGSRMSIEAGQIGLFWGATPHRLIDDSHRESSDICWVHIPLSIVLSWALPDRALSTVLSNQPIVLPTVAAGRDVESMFDSWRDDLIGGETQTVALLEAHALVRRLLHYFHLHQHRIDLEREPAIPTASSESTHRVTTMAQFVVAHFRESLSISAIAESAHLNTNYATTLFRRTVGIPLSDYLVRCRVAEAQRLLITTSLTTAGIATASGFGSQSSFYAHFTLLCACSPGAYRRKLR